MFLLTLLKTLIGWFVLMYLSTNLVGFVVRGVVGEGVYTGSEDDDSVTRNLRKEFLMSPKLNFWLTLASFVASSAYIYGLFRIFNLGVAVAAVMLMVGRIPDLLYEIRTGKKVTPKTASKGLVGLLATLLIIGSLPVIWFSLR